MKIRVDCMRNQRASVNKMQPSGRKVRTILFALAVAGIMVTSGATARTFYARTNLVSDVPGVARFTDTNLMGAWGITRTATSPWWVNSTLGGVSLLFNGEGEPFPTNSPLVVTIPPAHSAASGIVFNGNGGFDVASNASALFIFVTLGGGISGWSPAQSNRLAAVLKVNNPGASYTGVTLGWLNGSNTLYAANFAANRVDVFDQNYHPVTLPAGAFTDVEVPDDLSVFNVQLISSNLLFVTYAPTNVFGNGTAPGAGYVAVFSTGGILLGHLAHGPWMNAPWGMTLAPVDKKRHHNILLVGMFGNGTIGRFDAENGHFRGWLLGTDGEPITIGQGLWGLSPGNGANAGPTNVLYFAADRVSTNGFHGIFGSLMPASRTKANDSTSNSQSNDDNQY